MAPNNNPPNHLDIKAAEIRLAASTVVNPNSLWISVNTRAINTKSKPSSK
jgi:hypothetical protein